MVVVKFTALLLSIACANFALAQTTTQEQAIRNQAGQVVQPGQPSQPSQPAQAGQTTQQPGQVGQLRRLAADRAESNLDTFIASCLLIGNQEEVALAQLAVDRAENQNLKQFAQMLVSDHQKAIQKLQQHAKQGIGLNTAAATAPAQSPSAQQYTANRPDLSRGIANSTVDQILQIDQQAAQECLSMVKSMLQEKQGAEFDKAFAGMQVGAHVGMLAKLKASEQHVSPELASIIRESRQTVESHLAQAKEICKELDDSAMRQAQN